MEAAVQGPEFPPPPEGGLLRSLAFAFVAHLLLLLALSISVQWKRDDTTLAVEAEIWSPTVQQAAPKPVEAPPPPPPPPVVEKQVVQPPAPPVRTDADIALEREKERAAQEKARQEEAERQRLAAERKRQEDLAKQEQERARQEEARQQQAKQEQARQEQAKQQQARKAAEDRKREEQAKARQKQDEERLAKLHQENLQRMQGLAGATGLPSATGSATRSSGPSDSYGGRVRARVKPNIVFTDNISGNPSAEVDVRLAPDGTIVGRSLRKPSGVASWDEAVLRAIDRTEVLPRDIDGRVPSSMVLVFRPRD